MKYIHDTTDFVIDKNTVVALGNFDGLHKGHRQLIKTCKQVSNEKRINSVVFSFYPHPSHVLSNLQPVKNIYTRDEKRILIDSMNVDYYIEYPFNLVTSKITARDFIKNILIGQLNAKVVVVGSNYRFGFKREGDIELLKSLSEIYGYNVIVIDSIKSDDQLISSTYIRKLLKNGKIEEANVLLVKPYFINGTVTKGRQLGRTIGFPTINFNPNLHKQYPPTGVYITKTNVNKKEYISVTNIGYNPTIGEDNKLTIETHILNFDDDIYGQNVIVSFVSKIRNEISFPTLDNLIKQMKEDVEYTKQYYSKGGN